MNRAWRDPLERLHDRDLVAARERRARHDPMAIAAARQALAQRADVVRERVAILEVIEHVVQPLKRTGNAWLGRCPFHADGTASFAVYPRGGDRVPVPFFKCYGCDKKGDVIQFVMHRQGLGFREAIELLESENGLRHLAVAAPPPPRPATPQVGERDKLEQARRLWQQSAPIERDGPVDLYFRGRCLVPSADYGVGDAALNAGWPPDLRFHPRCWHYVERREFPALLAAIRGFDGMLLTVHRTYLAKRADGWGKAPVERAKLVVGSYGPGFIRLGPDADAMTGGEGIETSLSAMQLWKRSGICFVTAGRMRSIDPPIGCTDFIYAADKGGKGQWGERFAREGARAHGVGRKVAVKIPNIAAAKADFNDLLIARARGDYAPAVRSSA